MTDRIVSETDVDEIRRFKRSVWSRDGAGDEYHTSAMGPDPLTRAKNLVELRILLSHLPNGRLLDAGAGTGRFTIPLRRNGYTVFPLDLSISMLARGRQAANDVNTPFPATRGDIELLPFPDNSFDGVISMTVVRHFPNWQLIIAEFARVVRPGGRLIFDMASASHERLLREATGLDVRTSQNAMGFDCALDASTLDAFATSVGLQVEKVIPHDFLNGNRLLAHALADSWAGVEADVKDVLKTPGGIAAYEAATRLFLSHLSTALSPSWIAILSKESAPTCCPDKGYADSPSTGGKNSFSFDFPDIMQYRLGADFSVAIEEWHRLRRLPEVQRLENLAKERLLPHIPAAWLTYPESGTA